MFQEFAGNFEMVLVVINNLPTPVYARCVRINPTEWNTAIALRFDVIGC